MKENSNEVESMIAFEDLLEKVGGQYVMPLTPEIEKIMDDTMQIAKILYRNGKTPKEISKILMSMDL